MKTLQEAIERMDNKGGAGASLRKHFSAARIEAWEDITKASLYDFRDEVLDSVAPSTARTIFAYAKSIFNRYSDEVRLPEGWSKILSAKESKPMKTYLTEEELDAFAAVRVNTGKKTLVQNLFLICAYTGLRISDASALTTDNIVDGCIRFVAKKTKKAGSIPMKKGLEPRIRWVSEHRDLSVSKATYNETVRDIAREAGIDTEVVVQRAGKEEKGPKWKFLSSHTARISTATCLYRRGVGVDDIGRLLQHGSTATTNRYIMREHIELSEKAMAFFN